MEKTTLYFLCDLMHIDEQRRDPDDPEYASTIMWVPPETLMQKMKSQGVRIGREDIDESKIIQQYLGQES